ncbi:MAG TPA: haloacid dehalogenase-like hydrolase [Lacipirellula sp.]
MYAVLFDIDGTLVQTGGAGQLAFAEAFVDEFGVSELSWNVPFAGRSDRAIAFDLMRAHDIPTTEANWERFRGAYLQRLPTALTLRQGRVLPGVVELLDELQRHERPLVGLLTGNLQEGARHKLTYYGLIERFGFGGFGDVSDERCDIAAAALAEAERAAAMCNGRKNGNPLTGVMVIGDTPHDISCARSIGAFAVAVPTGNTPASDLAAAKPDLLLEDLSDPRPLLEVIHALR